jgi:hypothetical protein
VIRTKTDDSMISLLYRPLCVVLLLLGLFGLIRLRSNVVAVNYDIRNLEEKKTEALTTMKVLLAERSKYASLENIAASFTNDTHGGKVGIEPGYNPFGNRVRVIHIKKDKGLHTYRVSLKEKGRK